GLDLADLHALGASVNAANAPSSASNASGAPDHSRAQGAATPMPAIWENLNDESSLAALSPDGLARDVRLRDILAPVLANALRGSLRERVEGAWLALGGPACVDQASDLEDAEMFFTELDRLEEAGDIDMAALEGSLANLYAQPDLEADGNGGGAVQIMTI